MGNECGSELAKVSRKPFEGEIPIHSTGTLEIATGSDGSNRLGLACCEEAACLSEEIGRAHV